MTVTASTTDASGVASAEVKVGSGSWTPMNAVDGSFGGTSEDVTATVAAPPTAGAYPVCVRATDTADNTSGGTACATLQVMDFSLSAPVTNRSVGQGASAGYEIDINRSSFTDSISFGVSGLPSGTAVTAIPDPATGSLATLTVTTSNCGTVTPRGTYLLTVTGTGSGTGLMRSTTVSLTVGNAAPTIGAPSSQLKVGTMGRSASRVRTSWSGCDADGIASYRLQRQVDGGSWKTVKIKSATSRAKSQALAYNHTYRYRVRAVDKLGLRSGYVYGPTFKPRTADQTARVVHYSGTWRTGYTSSAYKGSLGHASVAGRSVSYTFSGSSIAWTAYLGPKRGAARVYLDGVYQTKIQLRTSSNRARRIVFVHAWASSGRHTITIVVVGTPHHPRVDVDAFVRLYPT